MATCVCTLQPEGNSGVSGALKLTQSSENGPTTFEGTIRGLTPGQKHGIALCVYGDLSDGGTSCGPTFNPFGKLFDEEPDDVPISQVIYFSPCCALLTYCFLFPRQDTRCTNG